MTSYIPYHLRSNLSVARIQANCPSNNELNSKIIESDEIDTKKISFNDGYFHIRPVGNRYTVNITIDNNNSNLDYSIHLDVDTTNCLPGDRLILIIKTVTDFSYNVNLFLSSKFYLLACGEIRNPDVGESYGIDIRNVIKFIYDGEVYLNSDDNC